MGFVQQEYFLSLRSSIVSLPEACRVDNYKKNSFAQRVTSGYSHPHLFLWRRCHSPPSLTYKRLVIMFTSRSCDLMFEMFPSIFEQTKREVTQGLRTVNITELLVNSLLTYLLVSSGIISGSLLSDSYHHYRYLILHQVYCFRK